MSVQCTKTEKVTFQISLPCNVIKGVKIRRCEVVIHSKVRINQLVLPLNVSPSCKAQCKSFEASLPIIYDKFWSADVLVVKRFKWCQHYGKNPAKLGLFNVENISCALQCTSLEQKLLQCKSTGNTKGGSITVLLTSCLTSLESAVLQLTIFVFICKTD